MSSRKTYSDLLAEIEQLKQQAEEVRRHEVQEVIARIKAAIAFYGLTAEDLGLAPREVRHDKSAPTPPPPAPAKKKKRKSRYTERPLAGPKL
jgi:DNA-binding protein H-NS